MTARNLPDLIAVGVVGRPHGVRGTVRVSPLSDNPERFETLDTVTLEFPGGEIRQMQVVRAVRTAEIVHLTFEGIDDRDEAETLRGAYICIPREMLEPLDDSFYHFELIGCKVITTAKQDVGKVVQIMDLSSNDILVVQNKEDEVLIPMIESVIKEVDVKRGLIVIEPIDGLLD